MTQYVETTFVAQFFAQRARAISLEGHKRVVAANLAVACNTENFAVEPANLHRDGERADLPTLDEYIRPEDSLFDEEYFLVDLSAIKAGCTLFKVSRNGTLHEFTRTMGGHWLYERTENADWAGLRLQWLADEVRRDHVQLIAG